MVNFLDGLSETARRRFLETMSQAKLKELDKVIDNLASAKYMYGLVSRGDGDPDERYWWDREASNSIKQSTKILWNLSQAIDSVRVAMGLPSETPYYEQEEYE
jgi:hypothetical protein